MAYGHPSIGILNVHINPYDNASMTIPQSVDIQSTFWIQLYTICIHGGVLKSGILKIIGFNCFNTKIL
jgi:hypothetical protein